MPTPVELVFFKTALPAGSFDLLFGEVPGGGAPTDVEATFNVTMPVPTMSLSGEYDNNVFRGPQHEVRAPWQVAKPARPEVRIPHQNAVNRRPEIVFPWEQALPLKNETDLRHRSSIPVQSIAQPNWKEADPLQPPPLHAIWQEMLRVKQQLSALWEEAEHGIGHLTTAQWQERLRRKHQNEMSWQEGIRKQRQWGFPTGAGRHVLLARSIPWGEGAHPGYGVRPPRPTVDPYRCYDPRLPLELLFKDLALPPGNVADLLFYCPGQDPGEPGEPGIILPIRSYYLIMNTVSLKRVSDNAPIRLLSANVSTDRGTWTWGFSGSVAYDDLALIEPTSGGPVEVELQVNAHIWRFLIEEYDQSKTFGNTQVSFRGRSVSAMLDDPYQSKNNYVQSGTLSSVQLAQFELDRASVLPLGFDLDWNLVDPLGWTVPAGTWSYSGLSPVQAIKEIAESVGGYVQSHPSDRTLIVQPPYPVPFWEWDDTTADIVVPKTLILSQNLRWTEKPLHTGVYVAGENNGVLAWGKRTGSAGDFLAEMYVHRLITQTAAAREKIIDVLSSGGKQAEVTIALPMHADLGIVKPGTLIEVVTGGYGSEPAWKGLVRGNTIQIDRSDALTIRQSISLERHYDIFEP